MFSSKRKIVALCAPDHREFNANICAPVRIIIKSRAQFSRPGENELTGKSADEHGSGAYSSLAGPLVLVEGLGVALDVDLLLVETRALPARVPVVLLVQASVHVLIQFFRGARQSLAADRTRCLVRFPLPVLYAYSSLRGRNGEVVIIGDGSTRLGRVNRQTIDAIPVCWP